MPRRVREHERVGELPARPLARRIDTAARTSLRRRSGSCCAIAADPQFAPAHAGYAYALYVEAIWGFVSDFAANLELARGIGRPRDRARPAGRLRAPDAGPRADGAGRRQGGARGVRRSPSTSTRTSRRPTSGSRTRSPSSVAPDAALASVDRAIRLSPYDPAPARVPFAQERPSDPDRPLRRGDRRGARRRSGSRTAAPGRTCTRRLPWRTSNGFPRRRRRSTARMRCSRTSRWVGCARCCRSSRG